MGFVTLSLHLECRHRRFGRQALLHAKTPLALIAAPLWPARFRRSLEMPGGNLEKPCLLSND